MTLICTSRCNYERFRKNQFQRKVFHNMCIQSRTRSKWGSGFEAKSGHRSGPGFWIWIWILACIWSPVLILSRSRSEFGFSTGIARSLCPRSLVRSLARSLARSPSDRSLALPLLALWLAPSLARSLTRSLVRPSLAHSFACQVPDPLACLLACLDATENRASERSNIRPSQRIKPRHAKRN